MIEKLLTCVNKAQYNLIQCRVGWSAYQHMYAIFAIGGDDFRFLYKKEEMKRNDNLIAP